MRRSLALMLVPLIAACGVKADLKPQAGKTLPVAPYGRDDPPGPEALLKTTPQATPERSVELRKRSEKRADDPFDLPPDE
ncbi:MAG: hypothetical protein ACREBO_11150 [Novosphingobium sp.]